MPNWSAVAAANFHPGFHEKVPFKSLISPPSMDRHCCCHWNCLTLRAKKILSFFYLLSVENYMRNKYTMSNFRLNHPTKKLSKQQRPKKYRIFSSNWLKNDIFQRAIWSVLNTFVCSPILFLAILCTYVLGYSTCEIIISDGFAPAVSTLQIGQYDNNKSNNSDEKTEKTSRWKWRKTADEKVLFRFFFAYSWQK